jgi:hypothetical protein
MKKFIFVLLAAISTSFCFGQAVYVNNFTTDVSIPSSPTDPPSTIDPNLSYGPWVIDGSTFVSYEGSTGNALCMSGATATTTTWTLPLTVNNGYSMALTSFNFWDKASNTGYKNWELDVNNIEIGSGMTVGPDDGAYVGPITISGAALAAVSNLTGAVNVTIIWSGGSHGSMGTGRIDDFTLNGTVTPNGCTGTPVAGIATAGTPSFCSSGSTILTLSGATTGGGISYQWQSSADGATWSDISGATDVIYTTPVLTSTTYYQCVTTCALSALTNTSNIDTVTVIPATVPTVSVVATPGDTICTSTSVTFTATSTGGGNTPTYQWTKNGISVGVNSEVYTDNSLNNNDIIVCAMTSSAACATPATATGSVVMAVGALGIPAVSISANPGDTICAGTPVIFTAITTNGGTLPAYRWTRNGILYSTGNTLSSAPINNGDIIECVLTGNGGPCAVADTASATIEMTVHTPIVPVITRNGNMLSTGDYVTYQWNLNNTTINGATNNTYTSASLQDGGYSVTVTDNNGCSATSEETLGIADVNNGNGVKIYPNPSTSVIYIQSSVSVTADLLSIDGKLILHQEDAKTIDMSSLSSGMYLITVYNKDRNITMTEKLIKE